MFTKIVVDADRKLKDITEPLRRKNEEQDDELVHVKSTIDEIQKKMSMQKKDFDN